MCDEFNEFIFNRIPVFEQTCLIAPTVGLQELSIALPAKPLRLALDTNTAHVHHNNYNN